MNTKETKQIKVFRELFGEDIKKAFKKIKMDTLLDSYGEIPLYSLGDLYDILEDGDYLIDINVCVQASGIFGETGYSMEDAIIKVNKNNDNYPEYCNAFTYNNYFDNFTDIVDLDFNEFLVIPNERDLTKARQKFEENKKRLDEVEKQIELLTQERYELYKKLT